jgi:predicted transcriptional regulator
LNAKTDLLIRIKKVGPLLNGRTPNGKKATYASLFKTSRYAIILLASIKHHAFENNTIKIGNTTFTNFYRLNMIAEVLGLEFDRTKIADKIYSELQDKGLIKRIITEDHKTFITLTEKGEKKFLKNLDELQTINELYISRPLLQRQYDEEEQEQDYRLVKGVKIKSSQLTDEQIIVDNLIKSISDLG